MSDRDEVICCLMVTRPVPERFELLKRSLACFQAQTYPQRELVVVLDQGPAEHIERIKAHLASLEITATIVQSLEKRSLGALRNLSLQAATGSVLCPWDDDDLCHPTRLVEQHARLVRENALAVALEDILYLNRPSREMHWLSFRSVPFRCAPNTVMFRREARTIYAEDRPQAAPDEDTVLVVGLQAEGKFACLAGAPHLFVYVYHGGNSYAAEHFQMLARSLSISRGLLERRRAAFAGLADIDLGKDPITVVGSNGPAFQLPG